MVLGLFLKVFGLNTGRGMPVLGARGGKKQHSHQNHFARVKLSLEMIYVLLLLTTFD